MYVHALDLLFETNIIEAIGDVLLLQSTDNVNCFADTIRVPLLTGHEGNVDWVIEHGVIEGLRF